MNEQQPLVSIAIPCYNHAKFVQEAIQSVIEQDYKNIELIIIDDGSKDNSVEVIQQMIPACEKRFVRFEFRYRPNKGLCATLNEALEWCEGEFFAPLASDDLIRPYKTAKQVNYLKNNLNSIGVFGDVELFGTAKNPIRFRPSAKYTFKDIFLHLHHLPAPTQFLRLNKVREIGGFRDDLIIEDWSMWLFLTENGGTLDVVNEVYTEYRRHDDNLSAKHDLMQKGREKILNLYKSNKLYRSAYSRALLVHAHGIQTNSKKDSLEALYKAIKNYPLCIFSKSFIWLLIKMIK